MPNAPDLTCSIILIFPKESINASIFSVGPVSSICICCICHINNSRSKYISESF